MENGQETACIGHGAACHDFRAMMNFPTRSGTLNHNENVYGKRRNLIGLGGVFEPLMDTDPA